MFARNPSPLGPSRISFEYLLLPPRSALAAVPHKLAPMLLYNRHVPPTHLRQNLLKWCSVGYPLQRHPFSGLIHSAGELLHTPYRIPTSMATVLLSIWINPFFGIFKRVIWRLNYTYGSSHIASPAYQDWPTEPMFLTRELTEAAISMHI